MYLCMYSLALDLPKANRNRQIFSEKVRRIATRGRDEYHDKKLFGEWAICEESGNLRNLKNDLVRSPDFPSDKTFPPMERSRGRLNLGRLGFPNFGQLLSLGDKKLENY